MPNSQQNPFSEEQNITAYCFQEGDIHFDSVVPDGALSILDGPEVIVRGIIAKTCELGCFSGKPLFYIRTVNAAFKRDDDPMDIVDDLGRFVEELAKKFTAMPVNFHC